MQRCAHEPSGNLQHMERSAELFLWPSSALFKAGCDSMQNWPLFLIFCKVAQGLLAVSYNLGDGALAVSLPSYQVDNGEWHHVFLERNENEFILRLDEGGGKREILKAAGVYKEIIIDPSSLVVGNTYPANQNHSFQGKKTAT